MAHMDKSYRIVVVLKFHSKTSAKSVITWLELFFNKGHWIRVIFWLPNPSTFTAAVSLAAS